MSSRPPTDDLVTSAPMSRKKSELMQRIKDGAEVNGSEAASSFQATLEKRVEEELKVR